MFERIEIAEQVYEVGKICKNTNRVKADHVSHGRKLKGGESASPTNPEKVHTRNLRKNHAGHLINWTNRIKTCLVHGPRHYT